MFSRRKITLSLTSALSVIALASGSTAAIAAEVEGSDTLSALESVSSASNAAETSVLDGVADVPTTQTGSIAIDSEINGVQVLVPTDASTPITLSTDSGAELEISLPDGDNASNAEVVDAGVVAFDSDTFATVPVVKDDGSLQITTILDGESAPSTYSYEITAAARGSLEVTEDGLVLVTNEDGSYAGAVAPAWARDADGRDVPTHYEVSGNTLTQVVDHVGAGFTYPIVADPWLGSNLFSKMVTGSEGGQPRYLIYRSTWGAVVSGYVTATPIYLSAGWDEAKNRWPVLLSKTTLRQQYDCHAIYAILKPDSWNLEKRRTNNSGWASNALSHKCNW